MFRGLTASARVLERYRQASIFGAPRGDVFFHCLDGAMVRGFTGGVIDVGHLRTILRQIGFLPRR